MGNILQKQFEIEIIHISHAFIKYNGGGKDISIAFIEESHGTSRNSPSDLHLTLQFHFQSKIKNFKLNY